MTLRLAIALAWSALPSLQAEPIISEFMASNSDALADGDGNYPDWIEMHNPDAVEIDLAGWGLRDDMETWRFPVGTSIPGGGYLVVFASGQAVEDYVDGGGHLHTTFKLDTSGEPLSLLRPDDSVAFEYAIVPSQREGVGYGLLTQLESLVAPGSSARYWVPDATLAANWIQPGFNDVTWTVGQAAVGYNTSPGPVLGGGSGFYSAYHVEAGVPGNQSYNGSLGMDFEVLQEIRVTDFGVFDDGSDGLNRAITAQLWSRNGNNAGAILATESFTGGNPGTLEGGSRFKSLPAPLVLAPGSYTMAAYGYGSGEMNGNQGVAALDGLDIDTGGGLIQFVGNSRFGNAGSFPSTVDGGPSNRYAAGTFKYSPHAANDIETDVEGAMHNNNSSIVVRVPFDVADPATINTLQLEMGYDDGFAAWVNGVPIANLNAPGSPAWNSAATAEGNATGLFPTALPAGTLMATGNVLAVQGLNVIASDSDFVASPQLSGISHDVSSARYFTTPTPGAPNDPAGIVGFVADTKFSVDRGFYSAPFAVAITSSTSDVRILYTTDGSTPTETHGTVYTAPISISTTTVLRAVAFKAGFQPSNVDTHSYLFLDTVATQGNPAGYPTSWGVAADYAMDQNPADYARAAGNNSFTPLEARAAIVASLQAIPTISIVTDRDNLFDSGSGIYLNPSGRGSQWERPVSMEIIGEDGLGRYQTNAGLRIMGFTSRNLNTTPKLNMRLLFKKEYGDAQMQYPILGEEGPGEFNTIALRGNIRDAWLAEYQGFGSASYIGDEWCKRAQFDMGQPAVRGSFAHVYLNGIYWGFYNPTERPDDSFAETYLGGDKSEYDVVKFCCPDRSTAGTIAMWNQLRSEANAGLSTTTGYQRIQGNNPDGSPNRAYPVLINLDNFIDYVINGQFHAQVDWPGNYYVIRDRIRERTDGFKFFTWDNDIPFAGGNPNGGNKVQTSPGHNWWTESPGEIEIPLRGNAEYRMRFADRVYKHYHHGGAMTVANNLARWHKLAAIARPALFAESARWGDAKGSGLRTVQDHWDAQNARMVNAYFPGRQAVVFSQMRSHNLYPDLDAPEFNQHGGVVLPGFNVHFAADATVYYTTDGSDPRLPGGAINPAATSASSGANAVTLLAAGAPIRALVPTDGSLGTTWRSASFNDSTWLTGTTGVGYEDSSGYQDEISLDLHTEMFTRHATAYLRIPFPGANSADLLTLSLRMKYDDGFIAYLNGVEVASRNPPTTAPAWDSGAGGSHQDSLAVQFEEIDLTEHKNLLSPSGNLLAIHGLNFGSGSSDFLIVPEIEATTLSGGDSLSLNETSHLQARAFDGSEWSALNEATFIVGISPTAATLAVSELMYSPAVTDAAGEFIEVMNISAIDGLDLTGVHFSDGITFTFPLGYTLAPGERAVLVRDPVAFATAHPGVAIGGAFEGAFNNGGELVAISDSLGAEILAFTYDNNLPWPDSADGGGPSLVLIVPQSAPDHGLPENWRASTAPGGSPGGTDTVSYDGGDLLAYALEGPAVLDSSTRTLSAPLFPGADGVEVVPQWSTDLVNWNEDRFNYLGGEPRQWRIDTPLFGERRLFFRLQVQER
ncbi:MAG: lamin tail domain-containing protein [Roseibacillus sp.]|nr:lamin tail domain-containing protein [Roseibacillus sp.]